MFLLKSLKMLKILRNSTNNQLKGCTKEGLDLEETEDEKEAFEELKQAYNPVCKKIKEIGKEFSWQSYNIISQREHLNMSNKYFSSGKTLSLWIS
jgi:hypothetical protein